MNGMVSVPITNCPSVRPLEMRARNMPTKLAQATHHAQKNRVHRFIHSAGWSYAIVSSVMPGNMLMKSPTFMVAARSRNAVSPNTRTQPASTSASTTLSWLRMRMPLSTPDVADTIATRTATTTRPT